MKWLLYGLGAYLLYEYFLTHGGLPFGAPVVASPGTEIQLPGGFSVTVPGGQTFHIAGGHSVTVMPGAPTAPGGWVQGMLEDNSPVWFQPASGAIYNLPPGMMI